MYTYIHKQQTLLLFLFDEVHNCVRIREKVNIKFFRQNTSRGCLKISESFRKISDRKISRKIFPEKCGKLFRQTSRKETTKNAPGTFPKKGGTFRQNSLWKRVFSSQISGENLGGFLTDSDSFPENPRGNFPGNSRKFRGETRGFFPVFSRFHGCNAGLPP